MVNHQFTAQLRHDPPDITISEDAEKKLLKLTDQISQLDGFKELARDVRPDQTTLHLQSDN
jgi:hypothetical protein